jgi:hypothetical protein
MKIENAWVNMIKVHIVSGEERMMMLKEEKGERVFRLVTGNGLLLPENEVNELDQIIIANDDEYYICVEVNKEVDEVEIEFDGAKVFEYKDPEFEIKFMSLTNYYIYEFHSILDNENLSWQEKPEMIRDLSNKISTIFSKCGVFIN